MLISIDFPCMRKFVYIGEAHKIKHVFYKQIYLLTCFDVLLYDETFIISNNYEVLIIHL